jgi:hypothetical protein
MSLVVDKALCPRVSWMTFMSIPAASISVAAVWLVSAVVVCVRVRVAIDQRRLVDAAFAVSMAAHVAIPAGLRDADHWCGE